MQNPVTPRAAFSPSEFAAACGKHSSWAYRLLYAGKINAITDLGRILIPASELDRVLGTAKPYNPDLSSDAPAVAPNSEHLVTA
jgi:hypothetical protein